MPRPFPRVAVTLIAFAVAFIALAVSSYTRQSATWDEPQHLTTGYLALKAGDYRLDPEHPPFLRKWAALPLLFQNGIKVNTQVIDRIEPLQWVDFVQFEYAHLFLYKMNDADALLYSARFMIVLLGVVLGLLVFAWAHELWGFWPAAVALGFYAIEPNILAHSSLVTTDFGITAFYFGTVYFLWRATRQISWINLAGLAAFFALACVSKFSAVLLAPVVVVLLAVRAFRREAWPCSMRADALASVRDRLAAAAAMTVALALITWAAIWASYGFRYLPSDTPAWRFSFDRNAMLYARTPTFAATVRWMDAHHLVPNAFSQGFLLGQTKAQARSTYLAGEFSTGGWWYFFPVAFLIKTPVALIMLFGGGLFASAARWRAFLQKNLFVLLPPCVYLAAAMSSKLNIGLRHILPIYPFVVLIAAAAIAEIFSSKRRVLREALVVLAVGAVLEWARVAPHYLAFFNQFVGGPKNGDQYLVDSNLDWGQDLKGLKRWMDANGVQHINLSYFGTADPVYYGIECTYLPGSPFFAQAELPRLPGYIAISATNLRGVYLNEQGRAFYAPLLNMSPEAVIGYSIYVYRVQRPWW